jgi:peptidoglycan/LPS O-acetylase OafA/YrhL
MMGGGAGRRLDAAATSGSAPGYEPGLDGVRALAVVAVLAFHDDRLGGGFLGVSTFFTLSGFLITGLILRERETSGRVSLRDFFGRRIRRLFPAAVAGVLLAAAVASVLHDAQTAQNFPGDALAALGDVANWRFLASGQAYVNLFATPSPLQHYWSLAVEEQFYLVLAPLIVGLMIALRGRRRALLAALTALTAASFVAGWILAAHGTDRAYYGTDTRAAEFLVGALLAAALARRPLGLRASRAFAIAGPFALAALVWANVEARVGDRVLFRGGLLAYACAGCVLLLAACQPGPVRAFCSTPPLRGLGRISYGVYVYHWPIFLWLTAARTGLGPLSLTLLRVSLTVGLAFISFHLLEQPIRERRTLNDSRRWLAFLTASATALGAAALVGALAAAPAVNFAATASPSSVLAASKRALQLPPPTRNTTEGTAAQAPHVRRVMVVGDSVALTLGRGIERWGAAHGVYVLNGGALGCPLLAGVDVRGYWGVSHQPADRCNTRESWPTVLEEFHPDVVVVLYGAWDVYDASFDGGSTWSSPGQPAWDVFYERQVADTAARLSVTGARLLWLAPPCFAAAPGAGDSDAPWYDSRRVDVLGAIDRAVARDNGMSVSSVVHDLGCPVDFADRPDGVHYADAGADAVAAELGPQITRRG